MNYFPKPSTLGYVGLGLVGVFGAASLARYLRQKSAATEDDIEPTVGFEAIEEMSDPEYGTFSNKHILSIGSLSRSEIDYVFRVALRMKDVRHQRGVIDLCRGEILASIFYEPSTRTSCSFIAAMYRLGGQVVSINDVKSSSVKKGESLEDTMRTLQSYCDIIVLRHPEIGSAARAAKAVSVPVLNAGDGAGEHPTQALLDLFTIYTELQTIDNLTITMVGDLKHGRTVHSLAKSLTFFQNVRLRFVSTDSLRMPDSVLNELKEEECDFSEHHSITDVIGETDVLYVTRIQQERFANPHDFDDVRDSYYLTSSHMKKAKKRMIVMHPLPRVNEISTDIDDDPRAAYFRQMENGLFVRMALLAMCLGKA